MALFNLFGRKEKSASIAKERLQIVLAHERSSRDGPDFLPRLQRDLLAVVAKYVEVKEEFISVNFGSRSGTSVLEINVEFDPARSHPAAHAAEAEGAKPKPLEAEPNAAAGSLSPDEPAEAEREPTETAA
jgi:cell division topological specificity factor